MRSISTSVSGRAKHIDVRRNFIQHSVSLGAICVSECGTDDMIADLLTKSISKNTLHILRDRLMGCPPRV